MEFYQLNVSSGEGLLVMLLSIALLGFLYTSDSVNEIKSELYLEESM